MVTIFMMSAKMATPDLLKVKIFRKKVYNVITYVNDVINKFLLRDSKCIADVVM